ncbi:unnamed protein product [Arctogadus glacialis]
MDEEREEEGLPLRPLCLGNMAAGEKLSGLQSTMDEEIEDGGPTSKTALSGEHGRQSKAKSPEQQQRADSPEPSCACSMNSICNLFTKRKKKKKKKKKEKPMHIQRVQQERADSPVPSCVSMKRDQSTPQPPEHKDGQPSREERHQERSKVTSAQSVQHQTELEMNQEELADTLWVGELRRIRSEFVKGVSDPVIKGLLDDLWQQKVFSTEEKDYVIEDQKSKVDRARCLIDMVMGKGERASHVMIDSMKKRDQHLCYTLGLISSLAGVGLQSTMDEEIEEAGPTSKTALSGKHGRRSKAKSPEQQKRADSPGPSCVSMKSDKSMEQPATFKDGNQSIGKSPEQQERADSPGPSCVSMKSGHSQPPDLKDGRPSIEERPQERSKATSAQSVQHQTELEINQEELADTLWGGELRRIHSEFVKGVSEPAIKGLLDDHWQQKVFSSEEKDYVMAERTKADQARRLIDMEYGTGCGLNSKSFVYGEKFFIAVEDALVFIRWPV